jgi:predicted Zn-dependent protease
LRSQVSQLNDPQLKDYVESSVYKLVETSQVNDRRLEFILINSPQLNAFAAPGGIVGVNGGLFLNAQTEGEYASVLAHELAHLSQRHFARGVEAQQRMQVPMMAALLAGIVIAAAGAGDAGIAPLPAPRRQRFRNNGGSRARTNRKPTVSASSTWKKPATTRARCRPCSSA